MAGQELLAEPPIEEGPVYEGVGLAIFDYLEFWDLDGLQAWGGSVGGESMSTPGIGNIIEQWNFNEPATMDNTSAPAMPQFPNPTPAILLAKPKKPSKLKNPGPLAAAIARSRRPNQRGDKWGT
jgi:hypothetical protein